MSAASQAHLQAAAQVASAIATALGAAPGAAMTPSTAAAMVGTVLEAVGSVVPVAPEVGLVVALAALGLKAYDAAAATGQGLTPAQWALLIGADNAAIAADKAAHPGASPAAPTAPIQVGPPTPGA